CSRNARTGSLVVSSGGDPGPPCVRAVGARTVRVLATALARSVVAFSGAKPGGFCPLGPFRSTASRLCCRHRRYCGKVDRDWRAAARRGAGPPPGLSWLGAAPLALLRGGRLGPATPPEAAAAH